jgi:hypothetical protein
MATHRPGAVDPAVAARQNSQSNHRLEAYEYRSPSTRNWTHSWVMINAETKPCKSEAPSGKRTVRPRPIVPQLLIPYTPYTVPRKGQSTNSSRRAT